jgi:hypothetical protein
LESKETTIKLGLEMFEIIKNKFINGLTSLDKKKTTLNNGVEVYTIINLSEPHASIWGSPLFNNTGVELYLLGFHGGIYPILKLQEPDISKLIFELSNFRTARSV